MLHKLKITIFMFCVLFCLNSKAQLPFQLSDSRFEAIGSSLMNTINSKPPEVLFGIFTNENNDIYFSMNNNEWFNKILKNETYGVSIDLVSKEKYSCNNNNTEDNTLPLGTVLKPVYKKELALQNISIIRNEIIVKIGKVPINLIGKQFEGNLIICINKNICYYSNFINIDRADLSLLPMGLFTDSLLQENKDNDKLNNPDFFLYTKKIQVEVPFEKGSSNISSLYLQKFYDSVKLQNYKIRKIEIRAYSSIEGSLQSNINLMKLRADAIMKDLSKYEINAKRIKIITAENWLEFFNSINNTPYSNLQKLSKTTIKEKLTSKDLILKLEPLLSKQRKAVITYYLEEKNSESKLEDKAILPEINNAVVKNDFKKAREIQKELFERILDNKFPIDYIKKIEVPKTKEFSAIGNDNEVYKYLLKATSEYEALENFINLRKQDPTNGKINYNICALRFFVIKNGKDKVMMKPLLVEINNLQKLKINTNLIKRMQINYNILKAEIDFEKNNYAGKDSAINNIHDLYEEEDLEDDEVFSLAKFYANYSHNDLAQEIIGDRIEKINTSEDLVFYYLNLLFYNSNIYESDAFQKAILNAINLNKRRWCNFFLPNDKGGASLQLLKYQALKKRYCESCK